MSANKPALYEGMFLFNSAAIQSSVAIATEALREILGRAEAEIVSLHKWDERKLAYPIKGQKRGLYILAYFKARGTQIPNIERDVTLSEQLLRCMILRGDHIGETELELAEEKAKETQAAEALDRQAAEAGEGETASAAVEGSGEESTATASVGDEAEQPTPEADEAPEAAPESGTRSAD